MPQARRLEAKGCTEIVRNPRGGLALEPILAVLDLAGTPADPKGSATVPAKPTSLLTLLVTVFSSHKLFGCQGAQIR
jgi:hypothetical protein